VGYRHAGHVLGAEARTLAQKTAEPQALVLRDETVVGRWRRTVLADRVRVEVLLREGDAGQVRPAVEEHARFLDRELELVLP